MKEDLLKTLQKFKDHIESEGYYVYAIMLKGSQNYNLHDEESDVDANAILIPQSVQDLRNGIKEKFEFPEGEVVAHDIYSFAEITAKGNPQWIEVCNTEFMIGESMEVFKDYTVNPSALKGMMMEKVTAFDKLYPSRAKYVEKFGYDPKQLHHIIRLYDMLRDDVKITTYHGEDRDYMMKLKRGVLPGNPEEAFKLRDKYVEKLNELYQERKVQYVAQMVDYDALDTIVKEHFCKG